jgi:predicted outer membrane repeat protein
MTTFRLRAKILMPIGLALSIGFGIMLLLSQSAQAGGGTVINCSNDAELIAKLGGGGSITFSCAPTTIVLSSQQIITQPTTINGGGVITISGGGLTRTFIVMTGTQLSLSNLTIYNSHVISPDLNGGGAIINYGALSVNKSRFISNSVDNGQGGGAIISYGVLTATNGSFSQNFGGSVSSSNGGGAIQIMTGTATIGNILFISNTSDRYGGAIDNEDGGPLHVVGSTFVANIARDGGAIDSDSSTPMIIDSSVFTNNVATNSGGGAVWADFTNITGSIFFNNRAIGSDGGAVYIGSLATIQNSQVYSNYAQGPGGGLVAYGAITVVNSLFASNAVSLTAGVGGGIAIEAKNGPSSIISSTFVNNHAWVGAGLMLGRSSGVSGTLIVDSQFISNVADINGGAIDNDGADYLTINRTLFDSNVTLGGGGAAAIDSDSAGPITIYTSTFKNNTALGNGCCGALYTWGPLTLVNSAVYNNSAAKGSGGLQIDNAGGMIKDSAIYSNTSGNTGGGLESFTAPTPTLIVNSTIANNYAHSGGGIFNWVTTTILITNSTIANNVSISDTTGNITGAVQLYNSIVSGGSPLNCGRTITSKGHNLESGNSCGLNAAGDLTNTNPLLMPLGNYGGSTWTLLPKLGSPAIDHGDNIGCPATDQRGSPRPLDGDGDSVAICDIGAVEVWMNTYLPIVLKNF